MGKKHGKASKSKPRAGSRKCLSGVVLALQVLFLLLGILKKIPAFSNGTIWTQVVYYSDFPQRWMISAVGLAAIANSFSVAGALFIWIVNLAPQRCCSIPMPVLYKWAYPFFREIFFLTMGLLFFCIYEGNALPEHGNPTAGTCFFAGGLIGSLYILNMCWTFVFNGVKLNRISHEYIIERISDEDEKESRFSANLLRKQLLEDCYNCLENRYYDNLQTILNESLVKGCEEISKIFDDISDKPEAEQYESVEKRIAFLREQSRAWSTILSGRSPMECARLLILDLDRLGLELAGERFPAFKLVERKENVAAKEAKYGTAEVRAHRVVWFFMIIQNTWDSGEPFFSQIYTEAVHELTQAGCSVGTVNGLFHQMLLTARLYFAIDRSVRGSAESSDKKWYVLLSNMWSQLSTPFTLTEAQFDRLLTVSAQLYAANNWWSLHRYFSELVKIQELGYSEKYALEKGTVSRTLRFAQANK